MDGDVALGKEYFSNGNNIVSKANILMKFISLENSWQVEDNGDLWKEFQSE